uniref:Alfin N-terminal domain-containing protein n=1 Tax=Nelumbo nucifera TaxID=4432 RepID=A0A822Y5A8_NELNU|nr:TPA_asm: hypothetical protein HUJ06_027693 [Nelumbo nucifera]
MSFMHPYEMQLATLWLFFHGTSTILLWTLCSFDSPRKSHRLWLGLFNVNNFCTSYAVSSMVAGHFFQSLLSVLLYGGRKRLFSLINDLPTVFEVVSERKPVKEKPSADSGSKPRLSTKVRLVKAELQFPLFHPIPLII